MITPLKPASTAFFTLVSNVHGYLLASKNQVSLSVGGLCLRLLQASSGSERTILPCRSGYDIITHVIIHVIIERHSVVHCNTNDYYTDRLTGIPSSGIEPKDN